jgi:diphthamide biosynthesis protein 2
VQVGKKDDQKSDSRETKQNSLVVLSNKRSIMEASGAPVLSTPAEHIFEAPVPLTEAGSTLSDEQLYVQYEIRRTVNEIRNGKWKRVALQFPDDMLCDAPRVCENLKKELKGERKADATKIEGVTEGVARAAIEQELELDVVRKGNESQEEEDEHLTILGDTSYGACCVDEVAAEHCDAEVVVHYGRSCLSPTARLPVIYVFTTKALDLESTVSTFQTTYPDPEAKVVLMADIPFQHHVSELQRRLKEQGYTNVHETTILHNPSSPLPNRTVPDEAQTNPEALKEFSIFHISDPPTSLLLTLSSRVSRVHILPTNTAVSSRALQTNTTAALRRRYALLTKVATAPIIGILINTLSVKNYMTALQHCQELIAAAGKKSYTFVVGKLNAAKIANFSEVEGWVVIGCWESSLIESSDFYRPIVTPFELEMAMTDDKERVWGGEWVSDFGALLSRNEEKKATTAANGEEKNGIAETPVSSNDDLYANASSDDEPPEFDLRSGRYVSHSRPMGRPRPKTNATEGVSSTDSGSKPTKPSSSLIHRTKGEIASVNGTASPGAEYLRSQRTWQGLGSDYAIEYERDENGKIRGATMEEGRAGVARGYAVSKDKEG